MLRKTPNSAAENPYFQKTSCSQTFMLCTVTPTVQYYIPVDSTGEKVYPAADGTSDVIKSMLIANFVPNALGKYSLPEQKKALRHIKTRTNYRKSIQTEKEDMVKQKWVCGVGKAHVIVHARRTLRASGFCGAPDPRRRHPGAGPKRGRHQCDRTQCHPFWLPRHWFQGFHALARRVQATTGITEKSVGLGKATPGTGGKMRRLLTLSGFAASR